MTSINLDCASDYELRSVAVDPHAHPLQAAYAANLLRARKARIVGRIGDALVIEANLDSQYSRMPSEVRW